MSEHPNATLLHEGYAAFAKGDLETIRAKIFASDVIFHIPGRSPISGDYLGIEQVFGFFGRIFEITNGTFAVEPYEILASEGYGVALIQARGERGSRILDSRGAHVYRIRNGRVSECWNYVDDLDATDAFFS